MNAVNRVEFCVGVSDICREFGISTSTFYKKIVKYDSMDLSMISRVKALEEINRSFKCNPPPFARELEVETLRSHGQSRLRCEPAEGYIWKVMFVRPHPLRRKVLYLC